MTIAKGPDDCDRILDNLPLATALAHRDNGNQMKLYARGFLIGGKEGEGDNAVYYLNNHLQFKVLYNVDAKSDQARIVGFEVQPFSVEHIYEGSSQDLGNSTELKTCNPDKDIYVSASSSAGRQRIESGAEVVFTYGVTFENSSIPWSSRWDAYLMMVDDQVHWFSIVNSVMIVLFLSGMVAMIMLRTLHRDIAAYNEMQTAEEAIEESGWKLVSSMSRRHFSRSLSCLPRYRCVEMFFVHPLNRLCSRHTWAWGRRFWVCLL